MSEKANCDSFEHLIEPPYDLERGVELNERAAEHDPDFKRKMQQGHADAERVKRA